MATEKSVKDCIFCKIVKGEMSSTIIYQDEDIVVFKDINPVTPVHMLIVTRKHIQSIAYMSDAETALVGKMALAAARVAREQGIADRGYRLIINNGPDAGQIVPHIHAHLMGGRRLRWDH